MLKKSIAVVFAIAFAMTATVASAQTFCNMAAYGDAAGTQSIVQPTENQPFSVFVVMFAEDTAAAAAYSMSVPFGMFQQARYTGPNGDGLVIDEPTGTNSALATCVIGFNGFPVLIDEYVFVVFNFFGGGNVDIGPNLNQGETPVYVTCNDLARECASGPSLVVSAPIPTDATSFSSIKSLYN
jgi:hypothetical protein